jgi:hypothetical protein
LRVGFLFLIIILLLGCLGGSSETSEEPIKQTIESEPEIEVGARTSLDTDGDGVEDKYTLTYESEEVAPGLFLQRKVEYEEVGTELQGTITIEFENKGNTREYTHLEVIPKSFAQSINDIEFSTAPTRIINPYPEVEWKLKIEKNTPKHIEIKAKSTTTVEEVFNDFDGQKKTIQPPAKKLTGEEEEKILVSKILKGEINCEELKGEEATECFYILAVSKKDHKACLKISDISDKNSCLIELAKKDSTTTCEIIEDDISKNLCYLAIGTSFLDPTACEKIELEFDHDPGGAADYDHYSSKDRDECIIFIAISKNDSSICTKILERNSPINKDGCILGIALETKDSTHCNSFINTTKRDVCILSIAGTNNDSAICNSIKDETIRKDCLEILSPKKNDGSTSVTDKCVELSQTCVEDCAATHEKEKYDYCREFEYSGCALDVFGWCNACADVYNSKWCKYPEYLGCAEGALATYKGCIDGCNAKRRAGDDVSTCWNDCNTELFDKLGNPCKDRPCQAFCEEKGFDTGVWAKYTSEYSWDSCSCSNKPTPSKTESPEDTDLSFLEEG